MPDEYAGTRNTSKPVQSVGVESAIMPLRPLHAPTTEIRGCCSIQARAARSWTTTHSVRLNNTESTSDCRSPKSRHSLAAEFQALSSHPGPGAGLPGFGLGGGFGSASSPSAGGSGFGTGRAIAAPSMNMHLSQSSKGVGVLITFLAFMGPCP